MDVLQPQRRIGAAADYTAPAGRTLPLFLTENLYVALEKQSREWKSA